MIVLPGLVPQAYWARRWACALDVVQLVAEAIEDKALVAPEQQQREEGGLSSQSGLPQQHQQPGGKHPDGDAQEWASRMAGLVEGLVSAPGCTPSECVGHVWG